MTEPLSLAVARACSEDFAYATLHDEVVVLRAEVERQQAEIRELNEEILRLDGVHVADYERWEQASNCIERQQADLETLRAAHDGTSVDWRTR